MQVQSRPFQGAGLYSQPRSNRGGGGAAQGLGDGAAGGGLRSGLGDQADVPRELGRAMGGGGGDPGADIFSHGRAEPPAARPRGGTGIRATLPGGADNHVPAIGSGVPGQRHILGGVRPPPGAQVRSGRERGVVAAVRAGQDGPRIRRPVLPPEPLDDAPGVLAEAGLSPPTRRRPSIRGWCR